jgi:transposase
MASQSVRQRLRESEARQEAVERELASLRRAQEESATLRRDYESLVEATRVVTRDRDTLRERVAELEAVNNRLVDMVWGRRSERRRESAEQQQLDFGDEPAEPPSAEEEAILAAQAAADEASELEQLRRLRARKKARQKKRREGPTFPPNIERRVRIIDLPEEQKQGLTCFRVDETERLRFEKPHAYVEVIQRPLYVKPGQPEAGVKSAPAPLSIVEGCQYDFSVVAAIVALKFAFHLPTYRQQDWFAQCGWFPCRSTVNDLMNYAVATVRPLWQQMWQLLLAESIVLGDSTTLRVLLRGELPASDLAALGRRRGFGKTADGALPGNTGPPGSATSYAWLYTGLDGAAPYNVFHWSLTQQNAVIDGHLATYRGTFVGDACGANAHLEQRSGGRIVHAGCNAHSRREFVAAESNDPVLASQGLSFYRQLYDVEERGQALDAAERHALRQREAVPIWNRMRRWLESDAARRTLPQSAIGKALGYLRNQWTALRIYLGDGRIPIDNNQAERTIRPLTVGRNNWLFLGHPQAATGRLELYSVVSSAHRQHLMIEDYLEDVLRRLADAQQNHPADLALGSPYLLELLPDRWALAHPKSVRTDRLEERVAVSEATRLRRLEARVQARAAQAAAKSSEATPAVESPTPT